MRRNETVFSTSDGESDLEYSNKIQSAEEYGTSGRRSHFAAGFSATSARLIVHNQSMYRPFSIRACFVFSLALSASLAPAADLDVITANPDPSDFTNGSSIATLIGADRFYAAGFNGSSAIVANVEAGHVWNGHQALTHLNTFVTGTGALGQVDRHATWVGMVINGRPTLAGNEYQQGIAHGATMWSAAIATVWIGSPFTRSFDFSVNSFADAYKQVTISSTGAPVADVTNSSWSDGTDIEAARYDDYSRAVDAIALTSGKTMVFSAGNRGPGSNSVGAPASGYNVIAVGSLGSDLSVPQYGSVSSFSSRGPQPIYIPNVASPNFFSGTDGIVIANARAAVDIVAPGENLVSAFYGGTTGGNQNGINTPGNNQYTNVSGTSFAAPIVAGAATLMADAARQTFGNGTKALDGRVMKANLLNSATKIAGWNNGQSLGGDGVIRTSQALDYAAGAGALNLNRAFDQLIAGTRDVSGTTGGTIDPIGWDYGLVSDTQPTDYRFGSMLSGGSTLTVTLDWFIDRSINLSTNATLEVSFDNLDLQIWSSNGGVPDALVAESKTLYNEVEHLSFNLPATDEYMIRVLFAGEVWDLTSDLNQTAFGLAWAGVAVPEPASAGT